jgi:predicted aldo/keto reductase-like oxidoreductase
VEHCPQHIRIPEQMQKIDAYVEALKQGKEF